MKFSTTFKSICCVFLSVLMSNVQALAATASQARMISTKEVVAEMSREQVENDLREVIDRDDVEEALVQRGISPDEVRSRIASLDEQELRQLHSQVQQARYGGTILVEILIVVLIIFLIKRM